MAKLLLGKEVTAAMDASVRARVCALAAQGVTPRLAVVRCGENSSDLAYERSLLSRAEQVGVEVVSVPLPESVTEDALCAALREINENSTIHGCLLFRPLPAHLRARQDAICDTLLPQKDVDGMTSLSAAGVYTGRPVGFPPCTAQACMEILAHYDIPCRGRRAVVIGRSLVIGKPAAMLLLARDATVTVCHTKTEHLPEITRQADILISAAGSLGSLTGAHVRPGQIVLDVSVNWDPAKPNRRGGLGAMAGDAVFGEVEPVVEAVTPVPGGVGTVTSSVLMAHVAQAAERMLEQRKG